VRLHKFEAPFSRIATILTPVPKAEPVEPVGRGDQIMGHGAPSFGPVADGQVTCRNSLCGNPPERHGPTHGTDVPENLVFPVQTTTQPTVTSSHFIPVHAVRHHDSKVDHGIGLRVRGFNFDQPYGG
jgi:hypothetical protein